MFQGLSLFNYELNRVSFEDIQYAIKHPNNYILINTLPITEQDCLIKSTLAYDKEEKLINDYISQYKFKNSKLLVYGKNTCDDSAEKKCKQLLGLGFSDIYLYSGGLFEWLLLQDIYGVEEFQTTTKILDILKYKPRKNFSEN